MTTKYGRGTEAKLGKNIKNAVQQCAERHVRNGFDEENTELYIALVNPIVRSISTSANTASRMNIADTALTTGSKVWSM